MDFGRNCDRLETIEWEVKGQTVANRGKHLTLYPNRPYIWGSYKVTSKGNCTGILPAKSRRMNYPPRLQIVRFFLHSSPRLRIINLVKSQEGEWWCVEKARRSVQSLPKKFVLGCVIPPAGAVARSRNLGQTFLANSVVVQPPSRLGHISALLPSGLL